MVRPKRTAERLMALFLLGVLLIFPPFLLVFNRPVRVLACRCSIFICSWHGPH